MLSYENLCKIEDNFVINIRCKFNKNIIYLLSYIVYFKLKMKWGYFMDKKEFENSGSHKLEQEALKALDNAGKGGLKENTTDNENKSADNKPKKNDNNTTENKNKNTDLKNDRQNKSDISKESDKSVKDDKADKTQEENKDELKTLIANAMENKKILESSKNDKKDNSKKSQNNHNGNKSKSTDSNKKNINGKSANVSKSGKPVKKADSNQKADKENKDSKNGENTKISGLKKRWSKKKKAGTAAGIIGIVIVLIIAIIIGLFFHYTGLLNRNKDNDKNYSKRPIDSSEITGGKDTFDEKEREKELRDQLSKKASKISDSDVTNILLVGEDVRDPADSGRGNTDVMMVVSINNKNKTITLTSLMRDMWVYMADFDSNDKLNAAYWHGGSEYLEKIIEDYFGISIDRYVSVNFQSFIEIVEAVGGLDFNVKENEAEAMKDPLDEVNDIVHKKHGTGYVKAGKQHLNGYQSLAYARIRYNCGDDYGRTQRQRAVIAQIIQKSKKLSLLELDDLLNKVLPNVTTDLTDGEISKMLLSAFDYMKYDVQDLRIPADGYFTADKINGLDVLSPDFNANSSIMQNVIYGKAKTVEEAIEDYKNGTDSQNQNSQ